MRYLEYRRHAKRNKPNKHLSQFGVTIARKTGDGLGPFFKAVSSDLPRALETAVAMGFAVEEQYEQLSDMPKEIEEIMMNYPPTFAGFAKAVAENKKVAKYAQAQADFLAKLVQDIPDGQAILVTGHGGVIEYGAVGSLPDADHASWGWGLSYCEGFRLTYDGKKAVAIEILRLSSEDKPYDEEPPY